MQGNCWDVPLNFQLLGQKTECMDSCRCRDTGKEKKEKKTKTERQKNHYIIPIEAGIKREVIDAGMLRYQEKHPKQWILGCLGPSVG